MVLGRKAPWWGNNKSCKQPKKESSLAGRGQPFLRCRAGCPGPGPSLLQRTGVELAEEDAIGLAGVGNIQPLWETRSERAMENDSVMCKMQSTE